MGLGRRLIRDVVVPAFRPGLSPARTAPSEAGDNHASRIDVMHAGTPHSENPTPDAASPRTQPPAHLNVCSRGRGLVVNTLTFQSDEGDRTDERDDAVPRRLTHDRGQQLDGATKGFWQARLLLHGLRRGRR